MINLWGHRYAYSDLNIRQCVNVIKYHLVSHKYAKFMCQLKHNKMTII